MTNPQSVGWQASPSQLKLDTITTYATGTTALDLGCGMGWYAAALADRGMAVTGIDQRNQVTDSRITVLEQPIGAPLPFAECSFDIVVMFDILELLPDVSGMLAEVSRVCRGRLLLTVPHADAGPLPQYGLTYLHYTDETHVREYLPADLRRRIEAHGFTTVRCELVGQPTVPLAISEFVRGGHLVRQMVRYGITALYKVGLVVNEHVGPDILYIGEKHT
ncbi:MAG: class I SAM-dependent methyltransferase [Anaerolineae bacterium]